MENPKYTVNFKNERARKSLYMLDNSALRLIKRAIDKRLSLNPLAYGKPLEGSLKNLRRLRVSSYRVIYGVNEKEKIVTIYAIGHRQTVYVSW